MDGWMDGVGYSIVQSFYRDWSVRTGHEQECASLVSSSRGISTNSSLRSMKESKTIDTNLEPPHSPTSPRLGPLDILKHLLGRPLSTLDLQVI